MNTRPELLSLIRRVVLESFFDRGSEAQTDSLLEPRESVGESCSQTVNVCYKPYVPKLKLTGKPT